MTVRSTRRVAYRRYYAFHPRRAPVLFVTLCVPTSADWPSVEGLGLGSKAANFLAFRGFFFENTFLFSQALIMPIYRL
jgi:hypothetical protein